MFCFGNRVEHMLYFTFNRFYSLVLMERGNNIFFVLKPVLQTSKSKLKLYIVHDYTSIWSLHTPLTASIPLSK